MSLLEKITSAKRKCILVCLDLGVSFITILFGLFLFLPIETGIEALNTNSWFFILILLTRIFIYHYFGLYNFLHRYASIRELKTILKAVTFGSLLIISMSYIFHIHLPRRVYIIEWIFSILCIGGLRLSLRLLRDYLIQLPMRKNKKEMLPLCIIGAGDAGEKIARELTQLSKHRYNLVGFIDDDPKKIGKRIHNIPVLGLTDKFTKIIEKYDIKEIIIAIPSAPGKEIRRLVELCESFKLTYKITPGLYEIIDGKVTMSQLRDVRIQDILGRDMVDVDMDAISQYLSDEVILVTGAGGSIGSELCRQVLPFAPKRLLILDNNETAIYHTEMNLLELLNNNTEVIPIIADVKNINRLKKVFEKHQPSIIFHAAAYKHVPLMEVSVEEAIFNNILGTKNVIELADQFNVKNFVLISTDKAVYPANCMGATKRICELLMQIKAKTRKSKTIFSAVRFGNVLGSQGSVVPLFRKQIKKGGPITVTHPEMTRYFMTIPEACRLVIQTGAFSKGGDIFVLDMGDPINITTLAEDMIRLSGLEKGEDIDIVYTGLRPGEKLEEVLFYEKENLMTTEHKKIFVAAPIEFDTEIIKVDIQQLIEDVKKDTLEDKLKKDLYEIANRIKE